MAKTRTKKAYCKECGKFVGMVPVDAEEVICFQCDNTDNRTRPFSPFKENKNG